MSTWTRTIHDRPVSSLVVFSLFLRFTTSFLLILIHRFFPSFDTSSTAAQLSLPLPTSLQPFVRWDTIHFIAIATEGYTVEQRLAFTPGLPQLMKSGGKLFNWLRGGTNEVMQDDMVIAGIVASTLATTGAVVMLYKLTLAVTRSRHFSLTTSILFLLAPQRAVLHAVPYTEPFSALFTFSGMFAFVHDRNLVAGLLWAGGTLFRAQGAVLGFGFFGTRFVIERGGWKDTNKKFSLPKLAYGSIVTVILGTIACSPFLAFQHYAYRQFCTHSSSTDPSALRPWCQSTLGFSYGWVQSHYWNVGPFRYWTLLQLPNFLIASPILVLSFAASYTYYTSIPFEQILRYTLPFLPINVSSSPPRPRQLHSKKKTRSISPFLSPTLIPYIHLHTLTTLLLLVSSHVQIVLRLCIVNPVVWWYASHLVLYHHSPPPLLNDDDDNDKGKKTISHSGEGTIDWGKLWIQYCIIWGTLSILLWSLFLPPA